jgi:hypothetical protein
MHASTRKIHIINAYYGYEDELRIQYVSFLQLKLLILRIAGFFEFVHRTVF